MNKMMSLTLKKAVDDLLLSMANKPDKFEKIKVESIVPLSDNAAAVVFEWESKRRVLFYFCYVEVQSGKWWHFICKDGHIVNMQRLITIRQEVLQHNFNHNCNLETE